MREAFEKADNVLATAAKCITDVINSTGQINVDFADVCTVMRNGGVAILGNAEASGENRAQKAIEEALNSPLLNDNEIQGAKWILININSAPGEHEFTMDEVEVIQNYLVAQAGEGTDVILGMGYDTTLENRIGITLIATGFEHKDPFAKPTPKKEEVKPEEKVVMMLAKTEPEVPAMRSFKKIEVPVVVEEKIIEEKIIATIIAEDKMMPKLVEEIPMMEAPAFDLSDIKEEAEPATIHWELQPEEKETVMPPVEKLLSNTTKEIVSENTVGKMSIAETQEAIISKQQVQSVPPATNKTEEKIKDSNSPLPAAAGGYLARPSNIYAESKPETYVSNTSAEESVPLQKFARIEQDELLDLQMQIVERDEIPAADMLMAHHAQTPFEACILTWIRYGV